MYELGGAKQAGSTYAHGGPAGKRGKSLREGRKNAAPPLGSGHCVPQRGRLPGRKITVRGALGVTCPEPRLPAPAGPPWA